MIRPIEESPLIFLGECRLGGVYLLYINLTATQRITFGRFNQGEPVDCPAGDYLYLGSARNNTLAPRLLRHMRRSGDQPVQELYEDIKHVLQGEGFQVNKRIPPPKRLHWHIDYLLDRPQAQIRHVVVVRTERKLEADLGRWLVAQPDTQVIYQGLGASDVSGGTHLLRVAEDTDTFMNKFIKYVEFLGY